MKKIEEKQEVPSFLTLDEVTEYLNKTIEDPYFINYIKFKNEFHILKKDGKLFKFNDFKDSFIEDYFHKNHYIQKRSGIRITSRFHLTSNSTKKFSKKDRETWINFMSVDKVRLETSDRDEYNKNVQRLMLHINGGEHIEVIMTPLELESQGFIRGTMSPEYWFYKTEIDSLDNYLPYRKFDNTYRYVDTKQLYEQLEGYSSKEDICKQVSQAMKENFKFGVDSLTYSAFEGIQYTFGVEIETSIGRLSQEDTYGLNLKAVHDGSLRDAEGNTPGGEYVSGVLKGDSGLHQLSEICRAISNKCKVNSLCGVHIHVGVGDWSKEDVVYSYILAEMLEKEIFAMLPVSRRNNSYCRMLTKLTGAKFNQLSTARAKSQYSIIIDDLYDDIYKEVTFIKGKTDKRNYVLNQEEGIELSDQMVTSRSINKKVNHPNGTKCGYDKNAQRYCWLNYITLLFDTKGNPNSRTLEFRPHSATMNFNKIKNWLKICFAFCEFVEKYKTLINRGNVSLEEVILTIYPKTGQELVNYIRERTQIFTINDESIDFVEKQKSVKKTIKEVVECVS